MPFIQCPKSANSRHKITDAVRVHVFADGPINTSRAGPNRKPRPARSGPGRAEAWGFGPPPRPPPRAGPKTGHCPALSEVLAIDDRCDRYNRWPLRSIQSMVVAVDAVDDRYGRCDRWSFRSMQSIIIAVDTVINDRCV